MKAPIVILGFNRPDSFAAMLSSLKKNSGLDNRDIFVFIDGHRSDCERLKVDEVEKLAIGITKNVTRSPINKGLAQSVIDAVTCVINQYGSVIVLEDDLVLMPGFLSYMDYYLSVFETDKRVLSICGYGLKINRPSNYNEPIYFGRRASSWGWGTWADRWKEIDWSVKTFENLQSSYSSQREFNKGGSDMYGMLKDYMNHKNNSWAIRFCYHQFIKGMYSVHPFDSLVSNTGFGENATNCKQVYSRFKTNLQTSEKQRFTPPEIAKSLAFNHDIDRQLRQYHSIRSRLYSLIRKVLRI